MNFTHPSIRAQIVSILTAWGMPKHLTDITAEIMVETDLMGVDSHGISMLMAYEEMLKLGQLRIAGEPRVVRDFAATALVDGADGLGHPAAAMGMRVAIEKARQFGIGAVGVVNSHHFGAAGYYARMASSAGLIGLVTSSTRGILMVPTRAAEPVLGTNPIAFAAPAGPGHKPVVLDMATTTVAGNKVKVYHLNDKTLPEGWVQDEGGRPVTDSRVAMDYVFKKKEGGITPVGGPEHLGGHKGYGLALMAHILGGTMVGASFSPIRNRTQKPDDPNNIGHFMMAIDPRAYRDMEEYTTDLDAVIDVLHGAAPADPAKPVLLPGEPEEMMREKRLAHGIPMPQSLIDHVRAIAGRAGVAYELKET
ncbi:Ldh family oxidoreductase [Roseococcus sp. YIM B11640]|uniref:Ldh family oxidoreductase n=1 Tax=Roseococcus sp. YIM B11640 TaxID=3133973 RepID=UPI003C79D2C5